VSADVSEDRVAYIFMIEETSNYTRYLLHALFFLDLYFDVEEGGDMVLRNVGLLPRDYMTLHHRNQNFITSAVRTSNSAYKILVAPTEEKKPLKDLGVDGKIILKLILKK
jgi:hypothetical protein